MLKEDSKRIRKVYFHLYKTLKKSELLYSDKKQIGACLGEGGLEGMKWMIYRQYKETFGSDR